MSDAAPVVHIGENSPEQVAYKLFWQIALIEGKRPPNSTGLSSAADRKWVLDTYAECLAVVRGTKTTGIEDTSTLDTFAQLGRQG